MQIQFTDSFKNCYQSSFGFNQAHIVESVNKKDEVEKIDLKGKEILLFKKKVSTSTKSFYWLTEAHPDGNVLSITSALRIYSDLTPKIEELSPLRILQIFAEKFGLVVSIGSESKKFFFKETIFINSPISARELIKISNPNNHDFFLNNLIKMENLGQRGTSLEIAIAYCLDTYEYKNYLNQNK